jgi:hypothetical protein
MADICVVYLVWAPLGAAPVRRFAASYLRHAGGIPHRLVVALKGFGGAGPGAEYDEALAGVAHERMEFPSGVLDIGTYFEAARRLECGHLCFLNTNSVLLDSGWLAKLHAQARGEGVGAAGATGSWNSHLSAVLYYQHRPSAYSNLLRDLNPPIESTPFALTERLAESIDAAPLPARLALKLYYYGLAAAYYKSLDEWRLFMERRKYARDYAPFPAYHLRTNAFMIGRETMLGLRTWDIREKEDAYRFEGGRESMTSQLLRAGLKVLVVGRDGRGYEKEEWARSETFWQGAQRNLLVADNQTRDYEEGDARRRKFLSRLAWGEQAAPALPPEGARAAVK